MKLIDFIICDDIRTEAGNKHSLMGIYGDSIDFYVHADQAGKWPKAMKLSFFIKIKAENDDESTRLNKFKLNIDYNGNAKTIAEDNINILKEKNAGIVLAIAFERFEFVSSGVMSVNIELIDKTGQVMNKLEMSDKIKITEQLVQGN